MAADSHSVFVYLEPAALAKLSDTDVADLISQLEWEQYRREHRQRCDEIVAAIAAQGYAVVLSHGEPLLELLTDFDPELTVIRVTLPVKLVGTTPLYTTPNITIGSVEWDFPEHPTAIQTELLGGLAKLPELTPIPKVNLTGEWEPVGELRDDPLHCHGTVCVSVYYHQIPQGTGVGWGVTGTGNDVDASKYVVFFRLPSGEKGATSRERTFTNSDEYHVFTIERSIGQDPITSLDLADFWRHWVAAGGEQATHVKFDDHTWKYTTVSVTDFAATYFPTYLPLDNPCHVLVYRGAANATLTRFSEPCVLTIETYNKLVEEVETWNAAGDAALRLSVAADPVRGSRVSDASMWFQALQALPRTVWVGVADNETASFDMLHSLLH